MACKYYIEGKEFTEDEFKQHLIDGGLDNFVKEGLDLSAIIRKTTPTTGTKNILSQEIRTQFNLPSVSFPKMGTEVESLNEGKRLVESGEIDPLDVINKALVTKEPSISVPEELALKYYMHQMDAKFNILNKQLSNPDLTLDEKSDINGQLMQLSDLYDAATEVNMKRGNVWGRFGAERAREAESETYNPALDRLVIKQAYGGEIPEHIKKQLDEAIKDAENSKLELAKLEKQIVEDAAKKSIDNAKKETKDKKINHKEKRASLLEELKAAKEEHEQKLKDNGIQQAGGISGIVLTPKMIKIIGEIAADYAKEGYEKFEEIVDAVYESIKDTMPGINKDDIKFSIASREAERFGKKAEKAEERISTGKLKSTSSVIRETFETNNEWVKARQKLLNAQNSIKKMKVEALNSKKNLFQLGAMWLSKIFRASILSGYTVLGKLASAATIGGAAKRIPEQQFGRVWSSIFKGISEKAPIEGFTNAKSEAKFYKEFFNRKKFWRNTLTILKTGESELGIKMSTMPKEDLANLTIEQIKKKYNISEKAAEKLHKGLKITDYILSLPMNSHMIIKDPLKRATFEASFENGLIYAEKNGLDIKDPLILKSIEDAAYKRANYEIFLEQRWLSKEVNRLKSKWQREYGNTGAVGKLLFDIAVPVSTVPTNIAARLISTSPFGLGRGLTKAAMAYKKGIETLKPEEADAVMRQLKQGSLGTALWLAGWFGYSYFGGLYTKYDPNKKRMMGDLPSGEMEVGGVMIPHPVQHAIPFEIVQLAATTRRIYNNYSENKGAGDFESLLSAGMGSIGTLAEKIPTISTGALMIGAFTDPYKGEKLKEDLADRFKPQLLKQLGIVGGTEMEKLIEKHTSTDNVYKNELKAYDKKGAPKQLSQEEFQDYKNQLKDNMVGRMQFLYLHGSRVIENGIVVKKTYDQLKENPDQLAEIIKIQKRKATEETKEKLLGEKKEILKEEIAKDKLEIALDKDEEIYQKSLKKP